MARVKKNSGMFSEKSIEERCAHITKKKTREFCIRFLRHAKRVREAQEFDRQTTGKRSRAPLSALLAQFE